MTALKFTKRRKKLFRSQAQAAEAMGITVGAISHFETGRRAVPLYVIKLLDCLESRANKLTG